MFRHFVIGALCGIVSYFIAAVVCYFLVMRLSSNTHDKEMEAGMTAAFVVGPAASVLGFAVGFVVSLVLSRRAG